MSTTQADTATATANPGTAIAETLKIGNVPFPAAQLPRCVRLDEPLGLAVHTTLSGALLYTNPYGGLYETRAELAANGDMLLMFPDGLANTNRQKPNGHYGSTTEKVNRMLALRSSDQGASWSTPFVPFDQPFNQHGFVPLRPRGTRTLCCFGTQPEWSRFNAIENAPIGWRESHDDGRTWGEIRYIDPVNDRGFTAMSVQRMTETPRGTWIIGSHTGTAWFARPDGSWTTKSRQFILRSEDRGASWTVAPKPRPDGWFVPSSQRLDELRPIAIGGDEIYAQARSTTGRIWHTRSLDDGRTWADPAPSELVHPDAPPMLFHLEDGQTLASFHHNVHTGAHFNANSMQDRGQLWVSLSKDGGRTWSEPRFLLANAFAPDPLNQGNAWRDYQCSYLDLIATGGRLHLFIAHRWQRALHLTIDAAALAHLPTAAELGL